MTLTQALIMVVFAFGGVLHGLTGIGVTLIATAALAMIFPLPHALVLAVLPCLVILSVVFLQGGDSLFYLRKYWLLATTSFIGSIIGSKLIYIIPANMLLVSMGVVIVLYVISQWWGKTFTITPNRTNTVIFGLLAGVVGGATNAMSSLIMMFLLSAVPTNSQDISGNTVTRNPKIEMVKASNLCYLVNKIAQLIVLFPEIIQLPNVELTLIGWATFICLICLFIGFYFREKISAVRFRQVVLLLLFVLGAKALANGLGF